jgi:YVTN family beta-propeller protein
VYLRRRLLAGGVGLVVLGLLGFGLVRGVGALLDDGATSTVDAAEGEEPGGTTPSSAAPEETTTTAPVQVEVPAPPLEPDRAQGEPASSGRSGLVRVQVLGGDSMSPKSVVASHDGVLFAQNMMYRHSISVFDAEGALVRTIPDSVDLSAYGIDGHPGVSKGAPVEMAFSPDGKVAWVSNYSMYGAGFGPEGDDSCTPGDGTDDSFVYKVDTATHQILDVIGVGAVPKYVAATPDGSKVLVTNWCTWDLSVIDTATDTEVQRIDLGGRYPRGIAISPDSRTAYIALMGSDTMVSVDLGSYEVSPHSSPGDSPRHVVISPDGAHLYVSNNRDGNVVKLDRATGRVLGSVTTGEQPRSLAISSDGEAIYVVNYESSTMSKVRTSDMTVMQTVQTDAHPIGITYEPTLQRVWVACYGGRILVFDDSKLLAG